MPKRPSNSFNGEIDAPSRKASATPVKKGMTLAGRKFILVVLTKIPGFIMGTLLLLPSILAIITYKATKNILPFKVLQEIF